MRYTIRPLAGSTWAALTERNNGVYGGCWCMGYHPEVSRTDTAQNRAGKERQVLEGRAHAALVIDEEQNGFTRVRQVGKHAWSVSRVVQPAEPAAGRAVAVSSRGSDLAGGCTTDRSDK